MAGKISTLVVEDSLTQAMRLRYLLEGEGYEVTLARNGVEALKKLREHRPQLIISDVRMPEMDGYELCSHIKSSSELSHIPVVLLTSLAEPADVFRALEIGADNFISKPYDDHFLLGNLRRILANIELRQGRGAEFGMEVFFAGKKHFLNSSRIQIIDFLLSTYESALQKNDELNEKNRQLLEALESIKVLQANYRQLLETNVDAVVVVDKQGVVRYANPAAKILFTPDGAQFHGTVFPFTLTPGERREIEIFNTHSEKSVAEMRTVESDWDGECVNLAVLRDITEHVRMREELEKLSLRDELTGLYNRRGFTLLAEQEMKVANRVKRDLFLMFIDLDGMKLINDTLGHQEGDLALCDMAQILKDTLRTVDIVGRIGGDEFVVLGIASSQTQPAAIAKRIEHDIEIHNATCSRPYRLSASIGIVTHTRDASTDLDELLEQADQAMYAEKRAKSFTR